MSQPPAPKVPDPASHDSAREQVRDSRQHAESFPLDYAVPDYQRSEGCLWFVGRMGLGMLLGGMGTILAVMVVAINKPGCWVAAGIVQITIFAVAGVAARSWGWRGFFVGTLTGFLILVGLMLLVAGICSGRIA